MNTIRRLLTFASLIAAIGMVGCGAVNQLWVRCPNYLGISSAAWSADGTQLSYIIRDYYANNSLYIADLATGTTTKLGDVPDDRLNLAWSPDATRLLTGYGQSIYNYELFFFDLNGGNHILVEHVTDQPDSIQWSTDGEQIAMTFYSLTDLLVLSKEGKIIWKLSDRYPEVISASSVAWSPDGKHLAFKHHIGYQAYLAVIESNGNNLQLFPLEEEFQFAESFLWSPDASKIAFRSSTNQGFALSVIRPDGSAHEVLVTDLHSDFAWLSDTNIVFYSTNGEIVSISATDGSRTILSKNFNLVDEVIFSLDGTRVTYLSSGRNGYDDLFVMNVDGTDIHQITHNPGNSMCFNWPF